VVALNMMDEVRGNGGSVNAQKMSEGLGVPVVPISAAKDEGIEELITQAIRVVKEHVLPARHDFCDPGPVHRCIHAVTHVIEDHAQRNHIAPRYAATKLVEGDQSMCEKLSISQNELALIEHSVLEMEHDCQLDRNEALADMRYTFIGKLCNEAVKKPSVSRERLRSIQLDKLLTSRALGLPVFFGVMLFIFWLTFDVLGAWLSDQLAADIDSLTLLVDSALTAYGINPVVHSLVIDGVFAGVGSVLSFLPIIVVLFFFLSILEDTGYMARVAFVMDKLLRRIGLSGRSIVPMLIGFGCTVPAIMATRTLSSSRDRKMTLLLTPFMSCSAKIPIYSVFAMAFFPQHQALVMIALYGMGILMAILVALLGKATLFKGNSMPFMMELPNYRLPSPQSVVLLMWDKAKDFLQRAFTVIFVATIIIWFLRTFDTRLNVVADSGSSLLAMIGKLIAPIFAPLGFTDWRISTALITGFSAKEAVVSTLSVLTGTTMTALPATLSSFFTWTSALSFLCFTLLYTPCVAAVAALRRELGSRWQTIGVVVLQCVIAWVVAFVVYRVLCLF
ncbi:MAG: ferrous iron transport protein B, partial [Clostridia bacterium]